MSSERLESGRGHLASSGGTKSRDGSKFLVRHVIGAAFIFYLIYVFILPGGVKQVLEARAYAKSLFNRATAELSSSTVLPQASGPPVKTGAQPFAKADSSADSTKEKVAQELIRDAVAYSQRSLPGAPILDASILDGSTGGDGSPPTFSGIAKVTRADVYVAATIELLFEVLPYFILWAFTVHPTSKHRGHSLPLNTGAIMAKIREVSKLGILSFMCMTCIYIGVRSWYDFVEHYPVPRSLAPICASFSVILTNHFRENSRSGEDVDYIK